jgi:hypothetical protein
MATKLAVIVLTLALAGAGAAHVQTASGDTVPLTADNFTRAETDTYFANIEGGGRRRQVLSSPRD